MTPVEALQKALAAEHAAVHIYGLLAARSSQTEQPALFAALDRAYAEHRSARDRLTVLVTAKDTDPVAAQPDYDVPGPVTTAGEIESAARTLETRITRTYGELVANTAGSDRRWAISALDESALREVGFGVAPSDFPGLS